MIFIDTSAIYALADANDDNHKLAKRLFAKALREEEDFLVHNYVIVESAALIQGRLGFSQAKKFLREVVQFHIVWVSPDLHAQGEKYLFKKGSRQLSLVDCISFVVMKHKTIKRVFAFDDDFAKAGFELYY